MTCKVVLLPRALQDLADMPESARVRVAAALRELYEFPHAPGIKKLRPPFDGYRKRTGEWRILFDFRGRTIFVHRIKNRKDAYRG